jgi:riboflavin synthase
MFTGLIEATGRIEHVNGTSAGCRIRISAPFAAELRAGDSIAVSGVCLTVVEADPGGFTADLSGETLAVTSFGRAETGRLVNLERPVRAGDRLGGHFVLGHVDGTGRIVGWRADGDSYRLDVETPADLARYLVLKGSIAIDGISLTIAALSATQVAVQIVPFTRAHTTLAEARVGDVVNLEADVLGKYVARILASGRQPADDLLPVELS